MEPHALQGVYVLLVLKYIRMDKLRITQKTPNLPLWLKYHATDDEAWYTRGLYIINIKMLSEFKYLFSIVKYLPITGILNKRKYFAVNHSIFESCGDM